MRASIVVVSYKGLRFLSKCLPTVLRAVEADGGGHEVIVVDNGSPDLSAAFVARHFPQVKVVRLPENRGAAAGYNAGVREASGDVVITLHHDIALEEGFLRPILDRFQDDEVFAVSSKLLHGDGLIEQLHLRCKWVNGLWEQEQPGLNEPDGAVPAAAGYTYYAPICNSAFRRERLAALGGFPENFGGLISAWLDIDVCYRAWKRGWSVLFEPDAVARHLRAHSWFNWGWQEVHAQLMEGSFLLIWANVTDPDLFEHHLAGLPQALFVPEERVQPYRDVLRLLIDPDVTPEEFARRVDRLPPVQNVHGAFLTGFARALPRLSWVFERRCRERPYLRRTDREVLALIGV